MKKRILITLIFMIIIVFLIVKAKGFLQVDKCLDSGGRWNYETENCEYCDSLTIRD